MMGTIWIFILFLELPWIHSIHQNHHLVDLTHLFNNATLNHPAVKRFEIFTIHKGPIDRNYWLQTENYESGIHTGTHIDAPCHFSEVQWCLDEIPIDRFFVPAAVLDVEEKCQANRDYQVTIDDILSWEKNHRRLQNEVLMIRTGWSKRWPNRELFSGTDPLDKTKLHFPGMLPQTAQWLVDNRNLYGIGTECFSLDYGQAKFLKVHKIVLGHNWYFLENVANLDQLPPTGATLIVLPMNIEGSSGAPVRIIALVPNTNLRTSKASSFASSSSQVFN